LIYTVPEFTINEALTLENDLLKRVPDPEFTFDFSRVRKFYPLPMLMMGAIMRRYRAQYPANKFYIRGIEEKTYAGTMGFFKYINPTLPFGKEPGEASGSTNYLPITPLSVSSLREEQARHGIFLPDGDLIEDEAGRLATIVDRGNEQLHILLTYLIREIIRNTPEHAEVDQIWTCGQYWPSYEMAEIAIMDEGIGVYQSITKNRAHREYITDNASALGWAIKAGISQAIAPSAKQKSNDEWANSGFGLYMVSQICKKLNGNFALISYGDFIHLNNHGCSMGKTSFHGTAIRIRVPSAKIENAKQIITEINKQGEAEAKTIRNAFKESSRPSKGLIERLNIT